MDKLLWTRVEAAKRLSIGLRTLDQAIADNILKVVRIGGSVRITEKALHDFIELHQMQGRK